MFDWQHFDWSRLLGALYPLGHILYMLCKRLKNMDLRNIEFLIRKTKDESELNFSWHKQKQTPVLPAPETEIPALPTPKTPKRKQAKN